MFVFKDTKHTYSDPVSATFLPGIPFGREKSKGDICLLHTGFAASKIFLNSSVLREALLNSKDLIEEKLDIKITDKKNALPPKAEKKEVKEAEVVILEEEPKKSTKKNKKEAEIIVEEVIAEPAEENAEAEPEQPEEPKEE